MCNDQQTAAAAVVHETRDVTVKQASPLKTSKLESSIPSLPLQQYICILK